jgi:hypothetical protein
MAFRPPPFVILMMLTVSIPINALAESVYDYEREKTPEDKQAVLMDAIMEAMANADKTDHNLSLEVYRYFTMPPESQTVATGILAFRTKLAAIQVSSKAGKVDLKTVQLIDVIEGIVKTELAPKSK